MIMVVPVHLGCQPWQRNTIPSLPPLFLTNHEEDFGEVGEKGALMHCKGSTSEVVVVWGEG